MSSFGIFPQNELSFIPGGVAKFLIVITSMYGTVEILTKIAGIICYWDKKSSE